MTFLDGLLHLLVLTLHLLDQVFVVIFLLNDSGVATLVDIAIDLLAVLLVNLLKIKAESSLLLIEEFLQLLQVSAGLDLLKDTGLNILDLMIDTFEESIDSGLQSL